VGFLLRKPGEFLYCSVFLYPSDKVFDQEDPFPANLVGRQPLLHELVQRLVANIKKLLGFLKGIEYSVNFLWLWLNWMVSF